MALHTLQRYAVRARDATRHAVHQAMPYVDGAVTTVRPAYEALGRPILNHAGYGHVGQKIDAGLSAYDRIRQSIGK